MLPTKTKAKIVEKFKSHETDTGSTEVQIAILSEEIKSLTDHLRKHPKDNHSRRGLLTKVARRRKLTDFLRKSNPRSFAITARKLGIKNA